MRSIVLDTLLFGASRTSSAVGGRQGIGGLLRSVRSQAMWCWSDTSDTSDR